MRSPIHSRPLSALISGEATQEEIDGALSARYSERDRRRAAEQALAAGFEPVPEPAKPDVPHETPAPPPQPKPLPFPNIDYPVSRFALGDVPTWGPWLIGEIVVNWPQISRQNHVSVLRGWISSNEHLFIRTSNSCALSVVVPHPFVGGESVVRGVFCWSRFPDEKGHELHLVQLHRHTADWARSRRAVRFELFEKTDLSGSRADFFMRAKQVTMRFVETR